MLRTIFSLSRIRRFFRTVVVPVILVLALLSGNLVQAQDTVIDPPDPPSETVVEPVAEPLNPTATPAQFEYSPFNPIFGDVNNDGVVDIIDVQLVVSHWGQTPADPGWDPIMDLNGDGVIDVNDILGVAGAWNQGTQGTPVPTVTSSATNTPTPTDTATPTPTATQTATHTPTPTVTATQTPTATPTNTPVPIVIPHCGNITSNETWISSAVHRVTCDVFVMHGITLTVQAGSVVKFDLGRQLSVSGSLITNGSNESRINFTSILDDTVGGDTNGDGNATSPEPGNWRAIEYQGGTDHVLDHVTVRYGGSWGTIGWSVFAQSPLIVSNSTIQYSAGTGITVDSDGSASLSIINSDISYNGSLGVDVWHSSHLSIENSVISNNQSRGVWARQLPDLVLEGNLFSGNGSDAARFEVAGRVIDQGNNTGTGNTINGLAISGVISQDSVLAESATLPYVLAGELQVSSGVTLDLEPGVIIKSLGNPRIAVLGTLTAQGTTSNRITFTSLLDDSVGGDTNGDGDATTPEPGNWRAIEYQGGTDHVLDHVTVRYGGSWGTIGWSVFAQSPLIVSNSTIQYSAGTGISIDGGHSLSIINSDISFNGSLKNQPGVDVWSSSQLVIENSVISSNSLSGVLLRNSIPAVQIIGNRFFGNGSYGLENRSLSSLVVAEDNWWGSDSGPAPYGIGNGINYTTQCVLNICFIIPYVDVIPWVGMPTGYGQNVPNVIYVNDPVNTANGNYAYQRTDLSIGTRGLPLEFSRSYNSLSPADGRLGWGWRHTWMMTAEESASDVRITYGDGRQIRFTWDGAQYVGNPGTFSTLTKSGGVFHLTEKDQTVYDFDSLGRLASVADKNGNTTTLSYVGVTLSQVTAPDGRHLSFTYDGNLRLSQLQDPIGRTLDFTYDIDSNLATVTDVTGEVTTYTYNADHHLLDITDANGHTFVRNVYNSAGKVIKQYDADNNKTTFAYDEPNHKTIVTDPLGRATTYQYDAEMRLTSEKDALNYTASFLYDGDNNRIQVTDKRSNPTHYAYDDRGNTTVITDSLAFTRTFAYDSRNNLLSETDARSNTTAYQYDARSNLTQRTDSLSGVTTWVYDGFGQMTGSTDANGHPTDYGYDSNGNLTTVTDALDNETTFVYDSAGRKQSETDTLGRTVSYTYDDANRVLTISEPLGKVTTYTYDAVGNRTSVIDPRGGVTSFDYDAKDRLIHVTDPLSHTTAYGYDVVNNQTTVTDPLGHTTTTTYDALNRRSTVKDALNHTVATYQYDGNGNRTSMTDANGNVTQYAYDALNRLTVVTDAAAGTVQYLYDGNGNRTRMTDANGHITNYAYDELNRLATVTDPLGYVVSYTYDAVGNRTGQTKADATIITYTFDEANRLTEVGGVASYGYDDVGNRTSMIDALGTTLYTYDALNRLTQTSGPGGTVVYGYDLNDNRTSMTYPGSLTVNYVYDLANRLTTVTDFGSRVTQYTYDNANRQTGIQYPNGVQAVSTYDDADRLLSLVHTHPVNGIIATATYTLDNVGNRLSMVDLDGATSYTCDSLHRLKTVTYPNSELVTYVYDPMGNRTSMTSSVHGATAYNYNAGDRLLSYTDTGGTTNLNWDANGNTTDKDSATYTFDVLDRLTQVVDGATTVQFGYNGDGMRLRKTVNGMVTSYLQDLAVPLPVVLTELTGGQTDRYVYGTDLLTQVSNAGVPAYYHADGLGSTRSLSNQSGIRTDAYSYDVFGETRSHTGLATQSFTYAGQEEDLDASLIFLRARYYDPKSGRFLSRDPVWGITDMPETLNRYVYATNNPVIYVDADGEFVLEVVALTLIGVGVYNGLRGFLSEAERWGNSYSEVLNTAADPNQAEGDYERASDRFLYETENVQKHVLKTSVTIPGMSLTGPAGIATSWVGLVVGEAFGGFKSWFYDRLIGIDSRTHGPGQVRGARYFTRGVFSHHSPGELVGGDQGWGDPPSGGK